MTRANDGDASPPSPTAAGRVTMLEARGVSHPFGAHAVLREVNLEVMQGEAVALVGESGAGKTTLLRCFNRMVEPRAGHVAVRGRPVRDSVPEELRRGIGYVPQDGGLLPHWTVRRNVELVPALLRLPDVRSCADEALALAGLPADRYGRRLPHELSGGQRQRVALARAIAAQPPVLLLDEPFGALDAISRAELQTAFEEIRRVTGLTALLVTHDLAEAARLCDTIVVMRSGSIEQRGSLASLRSAPATPYVASLLDRALSALTRLGGVS